MSRAVEIRFHLEQDHQETSCKNVIPYESNRDQATSQDFQSDGFCLGIHAAGTAESDCKKSV